MTDPAWDARRTLDNRPSPETANPSAPLLLLACMSNALDTIIGHLTVERSR